MTLPDVPARLQQVQFFYVRFGKFLEVFYTNLNPIMSNFNLLVGVDYQRIATSQTFRSVVREFVSPDPTDEPNPPR
jgi:hypothetical protein